jgi:hypothetical protein
MDRDEQTTEVRETSGRVGDENVTRQKVVSQSSVSGAVIGRRIVYYITGFIVILLLIRMILLLLGANQGNAFVDFVYGLSGVFAMPFYGIFSYTPTYGSSVFETSTVVAILVYGLVGWGIGKLFTIGSSRRDV